VKRRGYLAQEQKKRYDKPIHPTWGEKLCSSYLLGFIVFAEEGLSSTKLGVRIE